MIISGNAPEYNVMGLKTFDTCAQRALVIVSGANQHPNSVPVAATRSLLSAKPVRIQRAESTFHPVAFLLGGRNFGTNTWIFRWIYPLANCIKMASMLRTTLVVAEWPMALCLLMRQWLAAPLTNLSWLYFISSLGIARTRAVG
jgi:hypothetical protein